MAAHNYQPSLQRGGPATVRPAAAGVRLQFTPPIGWPGSSSPAPKPLTEVDGRWRPVRSIPHRTSHPHSRRHTRILSRSVRGCSHVDIAGYMQPCVPANTAARSGELQEVNGTQQPAMISAPDVRVQLPAVNCVFPVRCHPHFESVKEECDEWTLSFFGPAAASSPGFREVYDRGLYSLMTAVLYPSTVATRRLVLITKFFNWLLILDDLLDQVEPDIAMEVGRGFKSILASNHQQHADPASSSESGKDMRIAFFIERLRHDVWEEMTRDMSPRYKARVVEAVMTSLDGMGEQMTLEKQPTLRSHINFEEFMALRTRTCFVKVLELLLQYVLEIELDQQDEATEGMVQQLESAVRKHIIWSNDFLSCRKELMRGDMHSVMGFLLDRHHRARRHDGNINLSALQSRSFESDFQEVINEAWGMIREQEELCVRLLKQIRISAASDHIVKYAEGLCTMMVGSMYWCTVSSRYMGLNPIPWNQPVSISLHPRQVPSLNFLSINVM